MFYYSLIIMFLLKFQLKNKKRGIKKEGKLLMILFYLIILPPVPVSPAPPVPVWA